MKQNQRVELYKHKLTKQSIGGSDVQLGPARGLAGPNWAFDRSPPHQQEKNPSTPYNRFNVSSVLLVLLLSRMNSVAF